MSEKTHCEKFGHYCPQCDNSFQSNRFYTKDHPEANGRKPIPGEREYKLTFPLADGSDLVIHCGEETLSRFAEMLGSMAIDDAEPTAEKETT